MILEKPAPAPAAADPTQGPCKHQVMQTELSPIITRDHTLINNTSSKPSLFWLLKSFWHVGNCECDTIIIIDNSLSSIYINDGFIITLLCIIIILHLHPLSICPCLCCLADVSHCHCPLNVSMSQCVLTIAYRCMVIWYYNGAVLSDDDDSWF